MATASGPAATAWVAPSAQGQLELLGHDVDRRRSSPPRPRRPRARRPARPRPARRPRRGRPAPRRPSGSPRPRRSGRRSRRARRARRGARGPRARPSAPRRRRARRRPRRRDGGAAARRRRCAGAGRRPGARRRRSAAAPGSQSAGRPARQGSQSPQAGTKARTTWSPGSEPGDARADRLDLAGGLVAEGHGQRPRARAVDHREVRVAQAGRADADEQLPRAGVVELDVDDLERARLGVGVREPRRAQDGGAGPHARRSSAVRSPSGTGTGRREARSTKTCTNQPSAAASSAPSPKSPSS